MNVTTLRMALLPALALSLSCATVASPPGATPTSGSSTTTRASTCSADQPFVEKGWVRPTVLVAPLPVVPDERVPHARDRAARFRCAIGLDGVPRECEVIEALVSQIPTLLAVLPTWRFTPATCQGTPLAIRTEVAIFPDHPPPTAPGAGADASANQGVPGGSLASGSPEAPDAQPPHPSPRVIPFGEGMNRPVLLSGKQPTYTDEARDAGVEGIVQARCIIETEGELRNCAIVRSMPLMNDAVLAALATQRFTPVTFHGQATRVSYLLTFNFRLH